MNNPQASFQKVYEDILQKIQTCYWKVGEKIPSEEFLANEYGYSRMTVNRAIRELAKKGLVERRRKVGTRVVLQQEKLANMKIFSIRKEIEATGAKYRYKLLEKKIDLPPKQVKEKLSLKRGMHAVHLKCLHFADGVPYQYEQRWINLQSVPKAVQEPFEKINPNEWLMKKEPFSKTEQFFSAQLADAVIAEALNISKGSPLFVIERRTWLAENSITYVALYHPGNSFKLRAS